METARTDAAEEPGRGTPEATTLSYVVPAHNSTATVETTLVALAARLDGQAAEVLVVENGSTDGTPELLDRLAGEWAHPGVRLVVLTSDKGMGNAYRAGIAASRGARVLLSADDLPFGFDDLDAALDLDLTSHPVVIGSKAHRDSEVDRGLLRRVLTGGFWLLRRVVLGMRTLDPQGTFVVDGTWLREANHRLTESGYLLSTELCYLAERSGIVPVEVPVRLSEAHREHASRIAPGDVWRMAVGLFGIRRRHAAHRP